VLSSREPSVGGERITRLRPKFLTSVPKKEVWAGLELQNSDAGFDSCENGQVEMMGGNGSPRFGGNQTFAGEHAGSREAIGIWTAAIWPRASHAVPRTRFFAGRG
jgi:hypothetical protein